MSDLIKTIADNEEVRNFSEESDAEIEYQPVKCKTNSTNKVFDGNFNFISTVKDYNEDTWNDVQKYFTNKRKTAKNKVEEKIQRSREYVKLIMPDNVDEENGVYLENVEAAADELSDVDMKKDGLKEREVFVGKRKRKKQAAVLQEEFFQEAPPSHHEVSSFYQMNLSRPLMKAISVMNYAHPTPIQAASIPAALLGRDICGCAATGTGKTAAYILPILERLLYKPREYTTVTRVLILVPTRELGVQIYQVSKQLAQFTNIDVGLSVGGLEVKIQETVLRKSPDIVIATPGRLIDHLQNTPSFSLENLEILVLDEADRLLDENFTEQMKEIIKSCSRTRQTLLFSATLTEAVNDIMTVCMNRPLKIFVDSNQNVAFNLRQEFVRLRVGKETERDAVLSALLCRVFREQVIIFVRTKREAHKVLIMLGLLGLKACELHGNLSQPQRLEALKKFKEEKADFLIATDVAARGLDIRGVRTVINYTMPPTLEHYIHRVGRTARAGRAGVSVSIATESDRKIIKELVKQSKTAIKNRVIPPEIIVKYKEKLSAIESEIRNILDEEKEEKMMQKAEATIERGKQILRGNRIADGDDNKRYGGKASWFQTAHQRKEEKQKSKEIFKAKLHGGSGGLKSSRMERDVTPEKDRILQKKLQKIAFHQSRQIKQRQKSKRIRAVNDSYAYNLSNNTLPKKKKRSVFEEKLYDTNRTWAKQMRHIASQSSRRRKE